MPEKRAPFVMPIYHERLLSSRHWGGRSGPERTAFLALLVLEWAWDGLPDDPALLANGLGYTPAAFDPIWVALRSLWDRDRTGRLRNAQLEAFRVEELAYKEKRRIAGAKGNAARWGSQPDPDAIASGIANGVANESPPSPSPLKNQEEESSPAPRAPPSPKPARASRKAKPRWRGEIPERLRAPVFEAAWARWLRFRDEELRKPVTQLSGEQALAELSLLGVERSVRAIDHTIARGWQGIREPEVPRNGHSPQRPAAAHNRCSLCNRVGLSMIHRNSGDVCMDCARDSPPGG